MKIALAFPGCHRHGGIERAVFECARFLSQRGHLVTVFCSEWEADDQATIRYQRVPVAAGSSFLNKWAFYKACARLLDPAAFDVVGTHGCVCPTGGVHWCHGVHRAWLERSRAVRPHLSLSRIKQRLNPVHHVLLHLEAVHFRQRRYRKVVALTESVKQDLIRLYDVPPADIEIIPDGYSPEEFNLPARQGTRVAVRTELGFKSEDRVVIFVANELQRKGFAMLLQAVAQLGDPHLHVLCVGKTTLGPGHPDVRRSQLNGRVHFAGWAPDVARFYAAADVLALPTQYEPWGLVIVEAMACGLPVVASRLAGAATTIAEGRTGQLLNDPLDADELAEKLRIALNGASESAADISESVRSYAWANVLPRYEALLARCATPTPAMSTIR